MGAYLQIIDGLPDFFTDREEIRYLSECGSGTGGRSFTSTRDIASSLQVAKREATSSGLREMGECSSFWAGQLDDCFDDLRAPSTESLVIQVPAGRKGYSTRAGKMGRKEGDNCGSSSRINHRHVLDSGNGPTFPRIEFSEGKAQESPAFEGDAVCRSVGLCDAGSSGVRNEETSYMVVDVLNKDDASVQTLGVNVLPETEFEASLDVLDADLDDYTERLPDHLLTEVLIRVPVRDWPAAAGVKRRWGHLFRGDGLWHTALMKQWPQAGLTRRWPGPISRGSSKRRFIALHVSGNLFMKEKVDGIDEIAGHVYLFLKEQLESSTPPASYGLLHGTIIDQFLACSKTGDEAHELASIIWVAVFDNLDETENTFHLLMRIAEEWEVFLPYPYTKSNAVQWRLFERLFTDFRDCLSQYNYFDVVPVTDQIQDDPASASASAELRRNKLVYIGHK
ncbi:hypothetical protein AXG93_458s1080 [Marchantia polymorpha subsp. ruderalis]|uniref:Uncharacterized protein n=1 Tax=Marchantia polymorpha subsp. ruderalis TaxID=1480154 RepID=A0A176VYJ2_MARPO|nr:hypothetical protein AXG93_458s1080 [Marchantia polymorpha subsp. ruderalis]